MQFLRSILNILHLTEYFYTGIARNKYQVCDDYDDNADVDDDASHRAVANSLHISLTRNLGHICTNL